MKKTLSDSDMHENWVRFNCAELAYKMNRYSGVDEVIKAAEKLQGFVLGNRDNVVSITALKSCEGKHDSGK